MNLVSRYEVSTFKNQFYLLNNKNNNGFENIFKFETVIIKNSTKKSLPVLVIVFHHPVNIALLLYKLL